jgi:hypothetical protein
MDGNLRVFPHYHDQDPTRSQMRWWDRIREFGQDPRNRRRYEYIIGSAFDIVQAEEEKSAHVSGHSTLTMEMLVELYESDEINGFDYFLENGDFDIRPYEVDWTYTAAQTAANPGGGARKQSRRKQSRRKNKRRQITLRKSKSKKRMRK